MKIVHVVATRPNFVKVAPIMEAMEREGGFEQILIHTGQHYDSAMSQIFIEQLKLPEPDFYLGIGSGTDSYQIGQTMIEFEKQLEKIKPQMVMVVGDVNATVACAMAASKKKIPIAHVEAGLRSFDRTMPEETNRIITDALSSILFPPTEEGLENLLNECIPEEKIHLVGDVMVDTLHTRKHLFEDLDTAAKYLSKGDQYGIVTFHRPFNVDSFNKLSLLVDELIKISKKINLIFPVHPRTYKNLNEHDLYEILYSAPGISLIEPLGYLEFMNLVQNARFVLTDSGGLQTETTVLGVRCLTLRNSTEKNITVAHGTNKLIGEDLTNISTVVNGVLQENSKTISLPETWDGKASERIAQIIGSKFI